MPDSFTKFEFSRPVYMIYFTEDHLCFEPLRRYSKSYFVEEFMQNEAGNFKFCDAIWHASCAYIDGTPSGFFLCKKVKILTEPGI